jgi:hypothetical protein
VAEINAKQKPCAAKQREDVIRNDLFNAQFSNSQSCCSSVGAEQFGTFCTGFVTPYKCSVRNGFVEYNLD